MQYENPVLTMFPPYHFTRGTETSSVRLTSRTHCRPAATFFSPPPPLQLHHEHQRQRIPNMVASLTIILSRLPRASLYAIGNLAS